ncbi:PQQ-dependent sugar dehydrogenase [Myxococcaceae bacterium GXIMD 01537]
MRITRFTALACLAWVLGCASGEVTPEPPREEQQAPASLVPPQFTDTLFAGNLESATAMAFAPDGRLFICEQAGRLRVVENGVLLATPFLTVSTTDSGERGLLGVAFDPNFPTEPYVYVYYTVPGTTVHNRISRFTARGNQTVAGSEQILLELDTLSSANHNGGALHFGADGKLYAAVGEDAHSSNAQTLDNLLGKILRLEKNGAIPKDNPFYATAKGNRRAIWALGLRNPFSFAVQPGTGRILINDVGSDTWEEINEGQAGANHGWPTVSGPANDARFKKPLFAYQHNSGDPRGCAIAGGTFYNPSVSNFPSQYVGKYFFADYCEGWIRTLDPATGVSEAFATGMDALVDLDVGPDGSLYYLDRGDDSVHRIRYAASQPPAITTQPASQTVNTGQSATFSVAASGAATLRYQWQRGGVNIAGATSASLTLASVTAADSGARFRVRVTNDFGSVLSGEATLTVTTNTAPVATINLPTTSLRYRAGDTLAFDGSAKDAEDGTLPASAFTWRIDFHHDTHLHPFYPARTGIMSGSVTLSDTGETSANVWYRIHLTVKDSQGATHTVTRDIFPRVVKLRVATQPSGLQVTLDGEPRTAPFEVDSVVGLMRTLGAVSPQTQGLTAYTFGSWSDSGAATHDVRTPDTATTYTATFRGSTTPAPTLGLKGEYFGKKDLTDLRLTRVEPTINLLWQEGSPAASIPVDNFSARWTGGIVPLYSESYTFTTETNDGVRLWVNGQLLINDWKTQSATVTHTGTITLQAGQTYSLRMEFFEAKGWAGARLFWSSKSQKKVIVPEAQLRTTGP